MTNIIDIRKPPEFGGWTREVPESDTLLSLASRRPVKVFQMENIDTGDYMCMAHFDHDGWHNLYQDGQGIRSAHLFFWLIAWQGEKSPEDVALDFFGGKLAIFE